MRYESVAAYAFGPLVDRRLVLAPGLNVIWGPNEAGKSSWHAAMYAGLCGMRRARGKPTSEDQRFGERHRPWDGSSWDVGAVIRLEDGRRIELRHDLAGKVGSRASDADLGRDCSDEIIADGSPDGARWLGLDRRSFIATACVRQADLLGVLDDPSLLQEELQRAAATSGAAATAAAALARLEEFRADQVGRNIANSTRPLRRAQQELEAARLHADDARREHARYLSLADEMDRQEQALSDLTLQIQEAELDRERREIRALRQRHAAAKELARRFPDGPPSIDSSIHTLTRHVAETLEGWRQRPAERTLDGPSAEDLRQRLEQLTVEPARPVDRAQNPWSRPALALGGAAIILGMVAGVAGQPVLAALCFALGAGMLIWAVRTRAFVSTLDGPSPSDGAYREALQREIQRRQQDELDARGVAEERERRVDALRAVAERCGVTGASDDELAKELEGWLSLNDQKVRSLSDAFRDYTELARRQGDNTLVEIESQIHERSRRLGAMAPGLEQRDRDGPSIDHLTAEIGESRRRLAQLQGQRLELEQTLPSVAAAEERTLAAEMELGRVQYLEGVLADTQRFLTAAQDRVHRSIAPILADSIRTRIEPITRGRYTDVRVDPASLEVRVLDSVGQWREAALLSHGTAEQIYLLLRVALAEHLTRPGEICPLMLDDITAHCDDERTISVLDALHAISRERQVMLFSQESQVREWAEAHLSNERDRLELLSPVSRAQ